VEQTRKLGGVSFSRDEVRALLATAPARPSATNAPPGVFGGLVLPHPQTRGGARAAEIALTAIGMPIIAAGFLSLAILPRMYRRFTASRPSELQKVGMVTFTGGPLTWFALTMAGATTATAVALAGSSAFALVVRHFVRDAAEHRDPNRDLYRVDREQ
jgi:hypothetical protein